MRSNIGGNERGYLTVERIAVLHALGQYLDVVDCGYADIRHQSQAVIDNPERQGFPPEAVNHCFLMPI